MRKKQKAFGTRSWAINYYFNLIAWLEFLEEMVFGDTAFGFLADVDNYFAFPDADDMTENDFAIIGGALA